MPGYRKKFKPYIGQIQTARQLIRHRNIMLGLPIRAIAIAMIPWGYETDPDKEGWLRPVQKQLEGLYYARGLQRTSTLKACAEWLQNETGRRISRDTLRIIFRTRPPLPEYLLPLHDRISIATCETEDKALELRLGGPQFRNFQSEETRERYLKGRRKAVARAEEAKQLKRGEAGFREPDSSGKSSSPTK